VWPNGKAFFFRGSEYIRYDIGAHHADQGYPKPIRGAWAGLFDRDIDAAVVWPNDKAYFFRGSEYIRYDIGADHADQGYPKPIRGAWAGLFDRDIDAAVVWPNGKAYFFRGSDYIRYDIGADHADQGYPKPISSSWPGLVPATGGPISGAPVTVGGESGRYIATLFAFDLQPGEEIGDRIVRCCGEALRDGAMGQHERHDFYRDFIACNQEVSIQKAEQLTGVRTSCAMFVRAVRHWCGVPSTGQYVPGTAMFKSMGNVSFGHAAFVGNDGSNKPNPGDYFYISSSRQSNDGHTGIFLEEVSTGVWRTAEGGGGDGTRCRFTERTFAGKRFATDQRTLWGWFDCTKVGLPAS
jgi:hypothetical protein